MPRGVPKAKPTVVRYLVQASSGLVYWTYWHDNKAVLAYGWSDGSVTWTDS